MSLQPCAKCKAQFAPVAWQIRRSEYVCPRCRTARLRAYRAMNSKRIADQAAAYRAKNASRLSMYAIWNGMITRCHNPRHKSYCRYGARGITVCPRWRESFEAFLADVGPRPSPRHQIERKDNNADYSPENCVWATAQEQARNRRSNHIVAFRGEHRSLAEWAESTGIPSTTIEQRLRKLKWSVERALTTPVIAKYRTRSSGQRGARS